MCAVSLYAVSFLCVKYCFNAMDVESVCCEEGECCDGCRCHYHTDAVPLETSRYEIELDTDMGTVHAGKNAKQ